MMRMAERFGNFAAKGAAALLGRENGADAKPAAPPSAAPSTPAPTRGVKAQEMAASNSARGNFLRRMGRGDQKSTAAPADKPVYRGLEGAINIAPRKPPQEAPSEASTLQTHSSVKEQLSGLLKEQGKLLNEMAEHNAKNQQLVAQQGTVQEILAAPLSPGLSEGLSEKQMAEQTKMAALENPGSQPPAAAASAPAAQGMKRKADALDSPPSSSAKKPKTSPGTLHTVQGNGWTSELNLLVDGFKAAETKKEAPATPKPALSQQAVGYLARAADQFKKADTVEKEIQNIAGKFATPEQREKGVAMLKGRVAELRARGTELKQLAGIHSPVVGGKPSGAAQQMKGAEWFAAKNSQVDKATDQIKTELSGTTDLVRTTLTA
jgi:hypothetical protein